MPCLSRYNQAVTLIAPRYLALLRGGAFLFRKANAASGSRISHRASIGLALGVLSIMSPPSVAHNYPPIILQAVSRPRYTEGCGKAAGSRGHSRRRTDLGISKAL